MTPGLAGVEGRVAFRLETARMETGEGLEEEDSPSFTCPENPHGTDTRSTSQEKCGALSSEEGFVCPA